MKILYSFLLVFLIWFSPKAQEQKIVGDCTVSFSITSNQAATNNNLSGAVKTLYIKGKLARTDIASSAFTQSVIYNNATGDAVILKEVGGNKYITKVDDQKWKQQNSRYDGMKITLGNETKTILGYECKKGSAVLKDGSSFTFYYTMSFKVTAFENPYQFKDMPGFVLEYDIVGDDKTSQITYMATRINFNPVPSSNFDIPTTGYRVLNN